MSEDIEQILELSDELEEQERHIKEAELEIERLNKRIKELEEGFKATTEDLCEESTKIEKAIEYIEEHQTKEYWADEEQLDYVDIYLDEGEIIKVIKILKGSDKEWK